VDKKDRLVLAGLSKRQKNAFLADYFAHNFFRMHFVAIFSVGLKLAKMLRFFVPFLIFCKTIFVGSFQYFLETLKQNVHPMKQNIEK